MASDCIEMLFEDQKRGDTPSIVYNDDTFVRASAISLIDLLADSSDSDAKLFIDQMVKQIVAENFVSHIKNPKQYKRNGQIHRRRIREWQVLCLISDLLPKDLLH
eukprot:TRINITY_DN9614_c0_g1_i1.p3 TRINITY_DN9614_c0_g1~~TRINITY_DN9614_c0_g1_i1.p3  ORF type:complete len:105 (-),score=46.42 TRINITY_DN9614_c0_g1_i1:172-486(-)